MGFLKAVCGVLKHISRLAWWHPLIPAPKRQRQADVSEFKASLVYGVSSWIARAAEKSCLKTKQHKKTTKQKTDVKLLSTGKKRERIGLTQGYGLFKGKQASYVLELAIHTHIHIPYFGSPKFPFN